MSISVNDLTQAMVAAARPFLEKGGKEVGEFAASESAKMAQTITTILDLKLSGKIDEEQSLALLEMQRHAAQAVLCTIEGIGLIAAQNAINAALDAVETVVNKAIKFPLL